MLFCLVFICDPRLRQDVMEWLHAAYGQRSSCAVSCLIELQSSCIINEGIKAVITDLPQGTLLHKHYDTVASHMRPEATLIIINNATSDIFVPSGERTFTLVGEAQLQKALKKILAA